MKQLYKPLQLFLFVAFLFTNGSLHAGNAYSFNFNGTDESLYITGSSGLNVTDHWTFEAWIYVNSVSGYDDFMFRNGIFSFQVKDPLGSGDFALDFYNRDNSSQLTTDASEDLSFDTWYHVAATFDGTTAKLWVNGTVVDDDATAANWTLQTNSNNLYIGARKGSSYSNYYDGQIDEIRLSDVARTASEMQTTYRTEAYSSDANTLLLMHFDDKASPPSYDSGTGFSGTVYNHNTGTSNYYYTALASVYLLRPKYRTKATGNWDDASTWQYYDASTSSWEDATLSPDYYNDTIKILNGHTAIFAADKSVNELIVESGGRLEVASGVTVTLKNGTGTDLDVYGTLKKSGVILRSSGATITVENGGTYQHNNSGNVSTINWETGSTCEIIGTGTGSAFFELGNTGQNFYNFTWNVPNQSCDVGLEAFTDTYGDFTLVNTNGHEIRLHSSSGNKQVNIGGTGNCYIQGGTLNINSGSGNCYFVIYNNYSQTGGTITTSGTGTGYFRFGPLYVVHSGTFSKTGGTLTPDDFQVNRRYTLTLASDFDTGNIPFTLHGKMNIPTGYSLSFDSTFLIKSNDEYNGSLINHGTISSDLDVECYFTPAQWHGISAPVSGLKAGEFYLGGSPNVWMLRYNEPTDDYTYISDTNTLLGDMQGWFIWLGGSSNHTFTFEGAPRTGTVGSDNNMERTSDTTGYNFVGNPFTSAIDWDAASGWTKTNLEDAIYVYNNGNWATYINGTGTNGGSSHIAMNQGFFVRVSDGGGPYPEYGTLKMDADVCVHSDTAFMKSSPAIEQSILRLQISDNMLTDETVIRLTDQATGGWDDNLDARKLFSFNESRPQIFSTANGFMSVNSLPPTVSTIPLDVKGADNHTLTIALTEADDFDNVFLEDRYTGTVTNLKKKNYTFVYDQSVTNRFLLSFLYTKTFEHPDTENRFVAFGNRGSVTVILKETDDTQIELYNIQGQRIAVKSGRSGRYRFSVNAAGYYIVKVSNAEGLWSKKVFVR